MLVSGRLRRLLRRVPGRQRFGAYRFLPFFFVLGGAMEWFMINVRIGKETFCECCLCAPPAGAPQPPPEGCEVGAGASGAVGVEKGETSSLQPKLLPKARVRSGFLS